MAIRHLINENFRNILKLLNVAVILGVVFGLFFALQHITKNRYFHYEVYNIILLDLKAYLNEYLLVFILISLGVIIIDRLIARIFLTGRLKQFQEKHSEKKIPGALSFSLILIFILAVMFYSIYPDVISFLKSTFLAEPLQKLTKSRSETYKIFILIFTALGLIFIFVSTYILSRFNLVKAIQRRFSRITDSRAVLSLGAALVGIVLILNVFMFGYKRLSSPEGPNVILISIDTLRADHLGSYGYQRDTSPNIDELAEKGVLFENAISQGSWTYPSMASMHTSLYPTQIGIENLATKIHDSSMTLAEYMKNSSYNTYAVISNIVVSRALGFAQGFDTFDQDFLQRHYELSSHLVTGRAIEYLRETRGDKFFLWLHYMDPHFNYVHHPDYGYSNGYSGPLGENISMEYLNIVRKSLDKTDIQYTKDVYDEEISYTDHSIGRLLDAVEELGLTDDTIIILTSDHGDEFMERTRFGHGRTLYQELIHVPLIIYVPSDKGTGAKRVKSSVEVRSIARTILDLSGIGGTQIHGDNLLITAEDEDGKGFALSQKPNGEGDYPPAEAIISGNWKLIKNLQLNTYELYDLENDPTEKNDLFNSEDEDLDTLRKELIATMSKVNKERLVELEEAEFRDEDIRRLKALGYIE